ncbi:MAG: hypothetical protein Q7R83_04140 [bacterium]|nr:hypothetical protein [bacterium]
MNNPDLSGKFKWTIVAIGFFLTASVVLNLVQYWRAANSMLEKTHRIDKVLVQGDVQWTHIRTNTDEEGTYELWLTRKDKKPMLVSTFTQSQFSNLDLAINNEGGLAVSHWDGGPEGGTEIRVIYDREGGERARVTQSRPFDGKTFLYGTRGGPVYSVSYLMKEPCGQKSVTASQGEEAVAKVELRGISISYGNNNRNYLLLKPELMACRPYDSSFMDPTIKIIGFDEDKINIELMDGVTATISKTYNSYGTPLVPTVTFKQ